MKFKGFIGPTYKLDSVNVDCQRCVNLYPEIVESGTGKEAEVAYFKSTPGLEVLFEIGEGPIRLIHVDKKDRVFVISGNRFYWMIYDGTSWTPFEWEPGVDYSELETSTGVVKATSLYLSDTINITTFVDGDKTYFFFQNGFDSYSFGTWIPMWPATVEDATFVEFIDGYFIFNKLGTNQFFVSDFNTVNVDTLSFASAEGDPDDIVAIIKNHRDLWLIGERTIEIFVNTGNADFPFERVQGGFIEKGCCAPYSVAKIDGTIFWIGRDEFGEGVIYAAQGVTPQRISTHAIEQAIKGYADIKSATAYTYQSGGHSFYVLNFSEGTWVYDLKTGLWHERAFTNEGSLGRHRAECHAFFPKYSMHLLGDYESGKIYKFNDDYFKDDESEITRMRIAPHLSSGGKRLTCHSLQLDMEVGVGLDGSVVGSDPQVMLSFSKDGGHTWSSEEWTSAGKKIGAIGEYKKRVIWRRLGFFRDIVFKVKITDPVKVVIMGADLEIEGGAN